MIGKHKRLNVTAAPGAGIPPGSQLRYNGTRVHRYGAVFLTMQHFKPSLTPACCGVLIAMLLSACGEPLPALPAQQWEDIIVQVETRPPQAVPGMNEFLVVATRKPRKPAHDLIVSMRINDEGRWHQAIQDGHVGVYRRAIRVSDPARDVLAVRLERDQRVGVLHFSLSAQGKRPQ
ncbi:MAG TPA: hypothetical protein ENJ90_08535 [Devosia sp.]|nr:hypothetical protein [Devosia sp.]